MTADKTFPSDICLHLYGYTFTTAEDTSNTTSNANLLWTCCQRRRRSRSGVVTFNGHSSHVGGGLGGQPMGTSGILSLRESIGGATYPEGQ